MKRLEQELSAVHRLSQSNDWKYFDEVLKRLCYYDQEIYVDNSIDMARMVGARNVYVKLKKMIEVYNNGE